MSWPYRFAVAATAAGGTALAGGVALTALQPGRTTVTSLAFGVVATSLFCGLGLVVARRPSGAVVGLLLTVVGQQVAFTVTKGIGWEVLAARPATALRLNWLVALLQESAWWVAAAAVLVLLYFPAGQLPSRRWRWVPVALVVTVALEQIDGATWTAPYLAPLQDLPHPFGPPPTLIGVALAVSFFAMLVLLAVCAAAPLIRWRRLSRVERTQVKWLAVAGLAIPAYPLLCLAEIVLVGRPIWFSATVGLTGLVAMPLAVGVAMLRHDLYDVDRALAGAATWVAVSVGLVVLYGATTVAVGLFAGRSSPASAAVAVAVCAVALSPLRHRVQRRVDRRLHPLRRAAFDSVTALLHEVSTGADRPEALEARLRTALRDPDLRVGYTLPGADRTVDVEGRAVTGPSVPTPPDRAGTLDGAVGRAVPVVLGDNPIGVLVPGDGGLASADLLRQVAARCAPVVELVRLRLELGDALRAVEQSRARLVHAGFEERRRLERDLHDGAQQRLVSLGMALRLAQRHLGDGSVDVDALLDRSVAELGTAVAELRQIAHGLRPASLDDGLAAAVAAMLRSVPITVDLDICPDPLPDDVTTTAYYVVSEAVTNAVKHARATRISLRIKRVDGRLEVRVSDDGHGGAALPPTSSIPDRVAALRGTWRVDSPRGRGTVVEAELPCAS